MIAIPSYFKHGGGKYLFSLAILVVCLLLTTTAFAQVDVVQTLTVTRPPVTGPTPVTQSFIVTAPPGTPTAVVILLPGGDGNIQLTPAGSDGTLDINSNNFLVRSRWLFAGHGFYTITLNSASDFQLLPDGLKDEQGSAAHVTDVLQVIAWARTAEPGLPVWLVGTSRGTAGAFVAAQYGPGLGGPDGLVFTSPVNSSTDPDSLLAANLSAITVPVLLLGDSGDSCASTLPAGNATVKGALASSPKVHNEILPSGDLVPLTDSCNALSDHGFFGLEDKAVRRIAVWITTKA